VGARAANHHKWFKAAAAQVAAALVFRLHHGKPMQAKRLPAIDAFPAQGLPAVAFAGSHAFWMKFPGNIVRRGSAMNKCADDAGAAPI
jgi:hypothetical protein